MGSSEFCLNSAEPAVEQVEYEVVAEPDQRRVTPRAFIPEERVVSVDLDPLIQDAGFFQPGANQAAALEGNVRILAPPDVKQFAFDFARALERVVARALA